ncbi:polysaccharide biosynthesis tyrosine autokinase [Arthrobacter sp. Y81]|uniref:polysaccharide biosynthesis tyrosine autokinase n=1 Tax=Arthrobacter sp. Y81 TaxID=2058897 RepID=UPI000CE3C39A|nr:polysaccharide biosynthesis tyrosine autokinase [Arthrobacter sp. Y81]
MELSGYLMVLRRNWILITASMLLGLLVGGAVSLSIGATYTAKTQLFVAIQSSGSVSELQQGNTFSQARVQSYVKTAKTPAVIQPALDSLGLSQSPEKMAAKIEATADLNTVLINISVEDESPVQAAAIAQAIADSLIKVVDRLETPSQSGTSPVRLSVITPATAPNAPSSPNIKLNILLGLVVGLGLGIGASILRTVLDTKVRGETELRRITDAAILGGIAFDSDATKKPLLTQVPPQSPRAESFRQIRTNLQFSHVSHQSKTVLVTSSLPGEGKSTTAINMAMALAQSGQRVALVDADLRRPMVGEYLGLERNSGLTTVLVGNASLDEVTQPWGQDALYVLTSGQIPPNPSELLGSDSMKALVGRLEEQFDAVVIDAPPLLPVTDAAVLAQIVGGVVLVVGSQQVKTTDIEKSLSALMMVDADLIGIVLNKLPSKGPDAYAYTTYAYGPTPIEREKKTRSRSLPSEMTSDSKFDQVIFGQLDQEQTHK